MAMTKHAHKHSVTAAKQEAAAPPAVAPALAAEPAPGTGAPPAPPVSWAWRLVIFLWATSFVALFGYEVLSAVLRFVKNRLGG
jgi:hypothetical protein